MPRAAIESSTATPEKYREPHERTSGPWDDYELEDGGRALDHSLAEKARHLRKSGAISDKAMERAAERKVRHAPR